MHRKAVIPLASRRFISRSFPFNGLMEIGFKEPPTEYAGSRGRRGDDAGNASVVDPGPPGIATCWAIVCRGESYGSGARGGLRRLATAFLQELLLPTRGLLPSSP